MSDQTTDQTINQTEGTDAGRPRNRRRLLIVGIAVLLVAAVVAAVLTFRAIGSSAPAEAVPATVPVGITVRGVPEDTKIGVVVTLGDGEGSEWNEAAQGALVAERRLALGGTDITLVTKNDGGTTAGAKAAVADLAESGVAGIVVASSGAHVTGALTAAAAKGVPVVLPYAPAEKDSWTTAPAAGSVSSAMTAALGDAGSPLLVDLGGGAPAGLRVAHVIDGDDTSDTGSLAETIAARTGVSGCGRGCRRSAGHRPQGGPGLRCGRHQRFGATTGRPGGSTPGRRRHGAGHPHPGRDEPGLRRSARRRRWQPERHLPDSRSGHRRRTGALLRRRGAGDVRVPRWCPGARGRCRRPEPDGRPALLGGGGSSGLPEPRRRRRAHPRGREGPERGADRRHRRPRHARPRLRGGDRRPAARLHPAAGARRTRDGAVGLGAAARSPTRQRRRWRLR
ncbi:hypothetical protein Q9Q99_10580 [Curtobacterium flaccumfaciens]|nr:hypothetical protein Q9Q99_10580 [Curtobacterium flaccumfaciens]